MRAAKKERVREMTGMVGPIMAIGDHDRDGRRWWLSLMRLSSKRGSDGRLGLAYLSSARGLLFGGPQGDAGNAEETKRGTPRMRPPSNCRLQ